MNKKRIYLDASVYGGYFDIEFMEFTKPLFARIATGEFKILISAAVQKELEPAPKRIINLVQNINKNFAEFVEEDEETLDLATEYIIAKVVGRTSFVDCLHIALATINRADLLISWNFKHIVNIERIRGYNSINKKNGYKPLEIRSPREI